jgi:fatty acid desaturase
MSRLPASPRRASAVEWPTLALAAAVHGAWLGAAASAGTIGNALACPLLALAACWYMSLQHELLHGHPTRSRALNRLLGLAPLAVWYPYDLYRECHLAHHRDEALTQPGLDPESNYLAAADFARLPRWSRALRVAQRTVLGRLVVGPALAVVPAWLDIVLGPWRGDWSRTRSWAEHLALLAALLWALDRWAGIGPLLYLFGVAYPALGLAMLRSFHEHRPAAAPAHRSAVNEAGLGWRLLFLNNNYHAVHHASPGLPWYRLRAAYLADRDGWLRRNGGFLVRGYAPLLRRHPLTPIDSPVHPSAGR